MLARIQDHEHIHLGPQIDTSARHGIARMKLQHSFGIHVEAAKKIHIRH